MISEALPPDEALAALEQRCRTVEIEIAVLDGTVSGELSGIDQWRSWYAPGGERSTDENTGPGPS